MKILVTGTEGYLGYLLAPLLMEDGHEVVGLDTGFYEEGWLFSDHQRTPMTIKKDMRDLTVEDLQGFDAVVAMAELSNDPVGDLVGPLTFDINHKGSVHVATTAKAAGVERFVYMSSCSVYGVAEGDVDETSAVNPQTAYGECKYLTEQDLWKLADDNFHPTAMRNATAFGASPRQRFDIVLNNLAGLAWVEKNIAMTSDGTPWRPMVHALDICKAIRLALAAPIEKVHAQVFNVGSYDNNYTVRQIAETVANEFPGCELSFGEPGQDNRSYKVRFDKIEQTLGFSCDWNLADGAKQLHSVFEAIQLDADKFYGRGHTRLKMIDHLLKTGQVDEKLFWKKADA
ncbi:NAD-dependent epimerase/dehydratase family protein [Dermatophilus congolensis]|uniref:UDP-glucose 4-epimerase n=1 Tax=Dermatophilus congolensis TaxID=1863 RepID=A0A239VBM5_9MICO|nr:SDR family oxidoreductase [Dermatophilus congolensis]MBO3128486.1 SDR family oxidoreductase [Dermatophilus congolensis]MBO3132876.1 SDR family oxidoreductase [Dermatophilus congolensis]MBO3132965.1 SDR family oxidoreductase [Dermatophilus congolensis]MBO3135202.1 SDR family oxidoreductase [Dermatophilus congolensis]MBO3137438.1 SDR family oxidoreductase [Dermatophilus congolensis]